MRTGWSCSIQISSLRRSALNPRMRAARKGELSNVTGVDAPYEAPLNPDVTLPNAFEDLQASANKIIAAMEQKGLLKRPS